MNEESSRFGTAREELPPAESDSEGEICEVHSGVDLVKGTVAE